MSYLKIFIFLITHCFFSYSCSPLSPHSFTQNSQSIHSLDSSINNASNKSLDNNMPHTCLLCDSFQTYDSNLFSQHLQQCWHPHEDTPTFASNCNTISYLNNTFYPYNNTFPTNSTFKEINSFQTPTTYQNITSSKDNKCGKERKKIDRGLILNRNKEHERIHTGEKPYQCSYCTMKFKQKGSCTRHEDKKHNSNKP